MSRCNEASEDDEWEDEFHLSSVEQAGISGESLQPPPRLALVSGYNAVSLLVFEGEVKGTFCYRFVFLGCCVIDQKIQMGEKKHFKEALLFMLARRCCVD
jgi:hypothetical protein